jgi:peptidoglycan/LPS O-acetylase OafA/YrhL
MNRLAKRALRVAAFAIGVGILALGAGSVIGFSAIQSATFGAIMAVLGLMGAIAFTYAAKGEVPDADFDSHINSAIENVKSKDK